MSWSKRLIPAVILTAYGAVLVKLLVFKIDMLRIGHLRFRFAGETGEANLVPFRAVFSYLRGEPMSLIALLNLAGNVTLFVPVGLLFPLAFRGVTWRAALAMGISFGLAIEGLQVALRVGIFDVDDLILNSLGVMIGYWAFASFVRRARPGLRPA